MNSRSLQKAQFQLVYSANATYEEVIAALAQLVRAPVCGAGGPWFEPKRRYHPSLFKRYLIQSAKNRSEIFATELVRLFIYQ